MTDNTKNIDANAPMALSDISKRYEDMSTEELKNKLAELRGRSRERATGKVKSTRKSSKTKLKDMLKAMSPEERQKFLAELQKG